MVFRWKKANLTNVSLEEQEMSNSNEAREVVSNGGWCWYQDPRVVLDEKAWVVLIATVANAEGVDGAKRDADLDITSYKISDGSHHTTTIANIPSFDYGDDHHVAALWVRPDGRYLVVYTGHNYGSGWNGRPMGLDQSPDTFYRISTRPHDIGAWSQECVFTWPKVDPTGLDRIDVTYSNLLYLEDRGSGRGELLNIARGPGRLMHVAVSLDQGESWSYKGYLTRPSKEEGKYSNGYYKFVGDGKRRVDFIATEGHPRDYNNGIYHGSFCDGEMFNSQGEKIANLFTTEPPIIEEFSPIFSPSEGFEDGHHHGWTVEVAWDHRGRCHALFTTRYGTQRGKKQVSRPADFAPGDADHRLFHATLEGGEWRVEALSKMGEGLHDQE